LILVPSNSWFKFTEYLVVQQHTIPNSTTAKYQYE
jgi:hypothetical protein